jgi:hypothetical protein
MREEIHSCRSFVYGSVAKRSNAADCKSVGSAFAGSNPARPTILEQFKPGFLEPGFYLIPYIAIPAAIETLSDAFSPCIEISR